MVTKAVMTRMIKRQVTRIAYATHSLTCSLTHSLTHSLDEGQFGLLDVVRVIKIKFQMPITQKLECTFQNIAVCWSQIVREDLGQAHHNDIPISNHLNQRTDMCTMWSIIHHLFLAILRCYNHPLPTE